MTPSLPTAIVFNATKHSLLIKSTSPLEHDGSTLGYDCPTFDLTLKDQVIRQAIIPKGRNIVLKGRTALAKGLNSIHIQVIYNTRM